MPAKMLYPNIPENFPQLVKSARIARGLSLREMGELVGLNGPNVHQLEKGERNFSYSRAVQFRDVLELNIELPEPDLTNRNITRKRYSSELLRGPLFLNVDGELIQVMTYRKLGPLTDATEADHIPTT